MTFLSRFQHGKNESVLVSVVRRSSLCFRPLVFTRGLVVIRLVRSPLEVVFENGPKLTVYRESFVGMTADIVEEFLKVEYYEDFVDGSIPSSLKLKHEMIKQVIPKLCNPDPYKRYSAQKVGFTKRDEKGGKTFVFALFPIVSR